MYSDHRDAHTASHLRKISMLRHLPPFLCLLSHHIVSTLWTFPSLDSSPLPGLILRFQVTIPLVTIIFITATANSRGDYP
jgi:hypothetical protein